MSLSFLIPKHLAYTMISKRISILLFALLFFFAQFYLSTSLGSKVRAEQTLIAKSQTSIMVFDIYSSSSYHLASELATAEGQFATATTNTYPPGSCVPFSISATNTSEKTGDIIVSPTFAYNSGEGIDDLEIVFTNNSVSNITNLNELNYTKTSLSSLSTFYSTNGIIQANTSGLLGGSNDDSSSVSTSDLYRHYNITLSNVQAGSVVSILGCARLSENALSGSTVNIGIAQNSQNNISLGVGEPLSNITKDITTPSGVATQDATNQTTTSLDIELPDDAVTPDNLVPNSEEIINPLPEESQIKEEYAGETIETNTPKLTIAKYNSAVNPKSPGDIVSYTLLVTNETSSTNIQNTVVKDIIPKSFLYNTKSWKAISSLRGNLFELGVTSYPFAESIGLWNLGTLLPGEIVTLTYDITIQPDTLNGTFPDSAFATGNDLSGVNQILSNVWFSDGNPFVSTSVTVAKTAQNTGGHGSLTTSTLVNTGLSNGFILMLMSIVVICMTLILSVQSRKVTCSKKTNKRTLFNENRTILTKGTALAIFLSLVLPVKTFALDPTRFWSTNISQPLGVVTSSTLHIDYQVLSTVDTDTFSVKLVENNITVQTENVANNGGSSGRFRVATKEGNNSYYVSAVNNGDGSIQNTATIYVIAKIPNIVSANTTTVIPSTNVQNISSVPTNLIVTPPNKEDTSKTDTTPDLATTNETSSLTQKSEAASTLGTETSIAETVTSPTPTVKKTTTVPTSTKEKSSLAPLLLVLSAIISLSIYSYKRRNKTYNSSNK